MRNQVDLIIPNGSQALHEHLHEVFNIPRKNPQDDLLVTVAGLLIDYHALMLELRTTPLRNWIDENLSGCYYHNAMNPTTQAIKALSERISLNNAMKLAHMEEVRNEESALL